MSIADIVISLVIFLFQKLILPILPVNLPLISYAEFNAILDGSLKHNLLYAFAGLNNLMNLKLLFILLISIIFAETLFWLIRVGLFIVKFIRG
jgi:hypothetical protein